jgi:hypothetical protein
MRLTWTRVPMLVTALSLPSAALAGFNLPVNPERLDFEEFTFFDVNEGGNNQTTYQVEGAEISMEGEVSANAGSTVVTIGYETNFPNSTSASRQQVTIGQDEQLLVSLEVDFDDGGDDYFGQAAPLDCSVSAKLRDNEANDPDDPDNDSATVSCDLGNNLTEFDDDDVPGTAGDPPSDVLEAIEAAFENRNDVKVDVSKGKLSIKHKGEAGPL